MLSIYHWYEICSINKIGKTWWERKLKTTEIYTLINSHMKLYLYNNIFIDIKSSLTSDNISCANCFPNVHFVNETTIWTHFSWHSCWYNTQLIALMQGFATWTTLVNLSCWKLWSDILSAKSLVIKKVKVIHMFINNFFLKGRFDWNLYNLLCEL